MNVRPSVFLIYLSVVALSVTSSFAQVPVIQSAAAFVLNKTLILRGANLTSVAINNTTLTIGGFTLPSSTFQIVSPTSITVNITSFLASQSYTPGFTYLLVYKNVLGQTAPFFLPIAPPIL